MVADARAAVAKLLLGDPEGVVFGPSMTALTMRFARTVIEPGDEVVCTRLDHDANVRPWVLAGADVRFANPAPGTLELGRDAVEAVLTDQTKWVCVTAASNAVGTIPDLAGIAEAAHAVGARVYVDAVHATPHGRIDASGYDVLACSAYKWFGPHVGILCADPAYLETLKPDKLAPVERRGPLPLRARHTGLRVARRRDGGRRVHARARLGRGPRPRGGSADPRARRPRRHRRRDALRRRAPSARRR